MKSLKMMCAVACTVAFVAVSAFAADQSCCLKAIAKGEKCKHECCTAAAKDGKVCEKCNKDVKGCCAKALKDGKACDHPCCTAAAKDGKLCEKCNK